MTLYIVGYVIGFAICMFVIGFGSIDYRNFLPGSIVAAVWPLLLPLVIAAALMYLPFFVGFRFRRLKMERS